MLRILLAILLITPALHAQPQLTAADSVGPDCFYRHFTGKVGDRKVVIDLRYRFSDAYNFGGSTFYFEDEGIINFFLISKPVTFSHREVLRAQAFPENVTMAQIKDVYSIFVQTPRFDFTLRGDTLDGHWVSANGQPSVLTAMENYSDALQFEFENSRDSASVAGTNGKTAVATPTYSGIAYTKDTRPAIRSFINKELARFLGAARPSGTDELSSICLNHFVKEFLSILPDQKDMPGTNFSGKYTLFPVYNEGGFLVLQKGGFQFDFKTNDYTDRNLYLNLDIKNKKALALSDVITVDKDQLIPLLEKTFRKKYQVPGDKKLGDLFLEDKMPFTDNFILSGKGLTFSYSPAKIFRDNEDISDLQEMRLFIPFTDLAALLKPEFKKRMGL